jgi:hypothetical protein
VEVHNAAPSGPASAPAPVKTTEPSAAPKEKKQGKQG